MWRLENLNINLTDYLLNQRDRYYAKIRVHPWSGISLTNSITPQPKGKTKQKILNALIDIYVDWKSQLDQLGQPYYLKIWLFEPRFSQSQIVCAIGDNINFYDNTFFKPKKTLKLNSEHYGQLKNKLESFIWNYRFDEDHYDNTEVGELEMYALKQDYEEAKKWFEKLLKTPHRTHKFREPIGDTTESYSFKFGDIWLGSKD